ncbi:MAG: sigma-70 family RNA polymerase sigma factor [Muribaculaceae bacterium]|nr:sigma-70 family RNA polymerase sigma factor [Muribaculaceae bacterium]
MLSKLDEIRLLSQCALADNRDAFGRLVEAYQPRVRRFLLNLTMGDEMLTDDLAQETFIKAYVGIRGFKGMSAFGTWLYRIAYNEFYNHVRRHHEEHVEDIARMGDASTAATDAIEASMTVQEALTRLGDNERVAVTLFYIEDQPLKQVAKIMQMPEGSVKSLIHRAKGKMRALLGG